MRLKRAHEWIKKNRLRLVLIVVTLFLAIFAYLFREFIGEKGRGAIGLFIFIFFLTLADLPCEA